MSRQNNEPQYVLCVSNRGYPASLMVRRLYRRLADADAHERGLVRVVDESGDDYLYPEKLFVAVDLPRQVGRAFRAAR
jgi:hypothetical protein